MNTTLVENFIVVGTKTFWLINLFICAEIVGTVFAATVNFVRGHAKVAEIGRRNNEHDEKNKAHTHTE